MSTCRICENLLALSPSSSRVDGIDHSEELKGLLEGAGFRDVVVDVNKLKFMVVMGYKR